MYLQKDHTMSVGQMLPTHSIDTGTAPPIKQHPQRIPMAYRQEASNLIKEMVDKGTIQPSQSPWSSPIVLVKKKNGTLRRLSKT